jgi:hypothetical protein
VSDQVLADCRIAIAVAASLLAGGLWSGWCAARHTTAIHDPNEDVVDADALPTKLDRVA